MAGARGTGAGPTITIVYIPAKTASAIQLIQSWIAEDGNGVSEEFQRDFEELQKNRLTLRGP